MQEGLQKRFLVKKVFGISLSHDPVFAVQPSFTSQIGKEQSLLVQKEEIKHFT